MEWNAMNKILVARLIGVFLGCYALEAGALVTHTIINKSKDRIHAIVDYRGTVNTRYFKSCRPDEKTLAPGESLVSTAYGCLLNFVQIQNQETGKIIKLKVANASATIAKNVGLVAGFALIAVAVIAALAADDGHSTPIYVYDPYPYHYPRRASKRSDSSMFADVDELIVYAFVSTVWEYDGVSLVPKIGVKAYGEHNFTVSN